MANVSAGANLLHKEDGVTYQTGFGNTFESECLPGALPRGRNNPRLVPFGLYAEQLSGTAFTAPRQENRRTWLYRIQPSVVANDAEPVDCDAVCYFGCTDPAECQTQVNPLRWKPFPGTDKTDDRSFITGMELMCSAGDPVVKSGLSIYTYICNSSMKKTGSSDEDHHLYNADGEFLIVPQDGSLEVSTEVGRLIVHPTEIVIIPRGIVFQVNLLQNRARGYVLEVFQGAFQLPELGPIGSNGLANARDFMYPTAWCINQQEEYQQSCQIYCKMHSQLFRKTSSHSPYNVVAWHGNYLPYKYNLQRFCAVNSVSYDHLDPSIYTVLTCPSDHVGTALADFVIFPPRVMATDSNTLRPPWFHRNTMSEYMGLIQGQYDAKEGFVEGGASLHNCMTPHGPDHSMYTKAVADECALPTRFDGGLAFMFETCLSLKVAPRALEDQEWRDVTYTDCWQKLDDNFSGWDLLLERNLVKE